MCIKRISDGSFMGSPVYKENDYACNICRMPEGVPEQEKCPSDPSWKASFNSDEFYPCFLPCIVDGSTWYDMCSNFDDKSETCHECYDNFGFVDVIEED